MPKLWSKTIDAHRRAVRDTTLEVTAALVAEHGLRSVTMAAIADGTGVGRATLYKYFPDVESILLAWHERQVERHLAQLIELGTGRAEAAIRLRAVLEAYALIRHEHHGVDVAALLHRGPHVTRAEERIVVLVRDLVSEAAREGVVRDDVPPVELARYCVHALGAASDLPTKAATRRLVDVTMAGVAIGSTGVV